MNPNTEYPQGDLFPDVIENLGNPDVNGDSIVDLLDYYDIRDHYLEIGSNIPGDVDATADRSGTWLRMVQKRANHL